MHHDDYLMRQIESFGRALAKALGLDTEIHEIDEQTARAARLVVGYGAPVLATLSAPVVLALADGPDGFDPWLAAALAQVFTVEATADPEHRAPLLDHATALLGAAARDGVLRPRELADHLLEHTPSAFAARVGRFRLLEAVGRLAAAEDELFALAQAGWTEARPEGAAFYDRLQQLDDAALADGDFDRSELATGMADLREVAPSR